LISSVLINFFLGKTKKEKKKEENQSIEKNAKTMYIQFHGGYKLDYNEKKILGMDKMILSKKSQGRLGRVRHLQYVRIQTTAI